MTTFKQNKFKKNKKSQITFFVIIGIIILVGIFMAYSFLTSSTEKKTIIQQNKIIDSQDKIKKYNTFIDACLEQTTTDALVLMGKQGGALYGPEIAGLIDKNKLPKEPLIYFDTAEKKQYAVAYAITAPKLTIVSHPPVPQYPYGIVKLTSSPTIKNAFGNYPGISPLMPLCDFNDEKNKLTKLGCGSQTNSYDLPLVQSHNSMQEQLQLYITEKMKSCLAIDDLVKNFPELQKEGITIDNLNTTMSIKEDAVQASLTMKLKVDNKNTDSSFVINQNTISVPIRLKQLHALAANLIQNDINNIFFDITQDASGEQMLSCDTLNAQGIIIKTQCLKQNMKLYKVTNIGTTPNSKFDDLLVIEDKNKLINGKPYIFQVAIENRIPAVDLIKDLSYLDPKGYSDQQLQNVGAYIDKIMVQGESYDLAANTKAYDPDEDFHTKGFMDPQTYQYYYSDSCLVIIEQGKEEIFVNNPSIANIDQCKQLKTDKELTNPFTPADPGLYNIQVKVCDDAGLCDYQIVRVLVLKKISNP